ncbi:MAG: pentapeptide repeat-containing protein [Pirellulales bacterium]|nr:pentapeptide repeat-containing protein [Pirellulales bacterium]
MAKKKAGDTWRVKRFKGNTFCFGGRWQSYEKSFAEKQIRFAGGKIVDKVTAKLDYVVVAASVSGATSTAEKQAAKLNQKGEAHIQVVNDEDLSETLVPTPEEVVAMLSAGPAGVKHWYALRECLRYHSFQAFSLNGLALDGVKIRSTNLAGLALDGNSFNNADLQEASLDNITNCSFKKANLRKAHIDVAQACNFEGADLREAEVEALIDCNLKKANCQGLTVQYPYYLQQYQQQSADFTEADLTRASLAGQHFVGVSFRGAKLNEADLRRADLSKTDFSKADLTGANLSGANLSNAVVAGANFRNAHLFSVNLDGVDCSKAKGLDPATVKNASPGPKLQKLEKAAGKANELKVTADVRMDKAHVRITVSGTSQRNTLEWERHADSGKTDSDSDYCWKTRTFCQAMVDAAQLFGSGALLPDSIRASGSKSPVKGAELKKLAVGAWCEAFGVELPSEEELKKQKTSRETDQKKIRTEVLEELAGPGGAKKFNARTAADVAAVGHLRKAGLAGASLAGVKFTGMDLQAADFEGATLSKARFDGCKCHQANFKKAVLKGANLCGTGFNRSSFAGADLSKANLTECSLTKVDFTGADLTNAKLVCAYLAGCDLSTATLDKATLTRASFDEHTKFPKGFKLPKDMDWAGQGANPIMLQAPKKKVGSMTIEQFMEQLGKSVDKSKLDKALKMLKADRFQLFVQLEDDSLTGVVKSQTDAELVYSCRLAADGGFCCCTQNLNVCGGLRGTLCKHLLVLIIGLAQNGTIDAATVHNWVATSKAHKPNLDKDAMSETFLRYKGAEAGEIDWRPTETLPEDFYAL